MEEIITLKNKLKLLEKEKIKLRNKSKKHQNLSINEIKIKDEMNINNLLNNSQNKNENGIGKRNRNLKKLKEKEKNKYQDLIFITRYSIALTSMVNPIKKFDSSNRKKKNNISIKKSKSKYIKNIQTNKDFKINKINLI